MDIHISTLTEKGQSTIPVEIRKELNLKAGDKILYEIRDHEVILKKVEPFDVGYHQALSSTLSEWNSEEDDEAYKNL